MFYKTSFFAKRFCLFLIVLLSCHSCAEVNLLAAHTSSASMALRRRLLLLLLLLPRALLFGLGHSIFSFFFILLTTRMKVQRVHNKTLASLRYHRVRFCSRLAGCLASSLAGSFTGGCAAARLPAPLGMAAADSTLRRCRSRARGTRTLFSCPRCTTLTSRPAETRRSGGFTPL